LRQSVIGAAFLLVLALFGCFLLGLSNRQGDDGPSDLVNVGLTLKLGAN
jgi:hypothetical protein